MSTDCSKCRVPRVPSTPLRTEHFCSEPKSPVGHWITRIWLKSFCELQQGNSLKLIRSSLETTGDRSTKVRVSLNRLVCHLWGLEDKTTEQPKRFLRAAVSCAGPMIPGLFCLIQHYIVIAFLTILHRHFRCLYWCFLCAHAYNF